MLAGEQGAGAAEAGGDLVRDEQHLVRRAGGSGPPQECRRVRMEAAGALQHRLQNDGGELLAMGGKIGFELRAGGVQHGRVAIRRRRARREALRRQMVAEAFVQAVVGIADRHGGKGVAVVAAAQGEEADALRLTPGLPVLQGHFHGDFDGDRAGVAEEHAVQLAGRQRGQLRGQLRRRRMRQAAEHDMWQGIDLRMQGLHQLRVAVAVDRAPPGGHAVDQRPAVGQNQAHAFAADDRVDRIRIRCRRIRMPDMAQILRGPVGRSAHQSSTISNSCVMSAVSPSIREAEQYLVSDNSTARRTWASDRPCP